MRFRIIKYEYEPPRASIYYALFKRRWWGRWKGFTQLGNLTACFTLVQGHYSYDEAFDTLVRRLHMEDLKHKYPIVTICDQGKLKKGGDQ